MKARHHRFNFSRTCTAAALLSEPTFQQASYPSKVPIDLAQAAHSLQINNRTEQNGSGHSIQQPIGTLTEAYPLALHALLAWRNRRPSRTPVGNSSGPGTKGDQSFAAVRLYHAGATARSRSNKPLRLEPHQVLMVVAAATVSLAEQDAVEPQVSKAWCWGEQAQLVGPQHTSCRLVVGDLMRFKIQHP